MIFFSYFKNKSCKKIKKELLNYNKFKNIFTFLTLTQKKLKRHKFVSKGRLHRIEKKNSNLILFKKINKIQYILSIKKNLIWEIK